MENGKFLHVAVFPWLAMGHLIPFLHLSKLLAQKGHKVSFISTPRNLQRLPKIPPNLSSLVTLVSLPFPPLKNLPPHAQCSSDIPYYKQQALKQAFDLLQSPLKIFLQESHPDWIVFDYASHWVPSLAASLGLSCAYFSLFTAACLAFIGPDGGDSRSTAEDFTVSPKWFPFESNLVYRLHEVSKYVEKSSQDDAGVSDVVRFATSMAESDVVAIRSSADFEPEWFNLLPQLYKKPFVSTGFFPPLRSDHEEDGENDNKNWASIKEWLEKQRVNSVVYVALGSEVSLSREELTELALGLELSEMPFFLVLRNSAESTQDVLEMLPEGFEERVKGRGFVYGGWAPQLKILSHVSVGGFLTHCGWNSVIEGLSLGRVLILFPVLNDQGLNARLLSAKKVGLEIPRNERDGWFSRESVAESMRSAMVDESGESLRTKAREMRSLFGDKDRNDRDLDHFVRYMEDNRRKN